MRPLPSLVAVAAGARPGLLFTGVLDLLDGQRGRLFLWLPVCFAVGIGVFFALPREPSIVFLGALAGLTLIGGIALRKASLLVAPLGIALLMICLGFLNAGLRTHLVAAPVLTYRYYGSVEGRVIRIDRSATDALRLTLDRVRLHDVPPARTPERVRIALHSDAGQRSPEPGMRLAMTAHLSPPPGPAEPGGFDFKRMAWFDRLGAVGYTRVPALRTGGDEELATLRLYHLRQRLSTALQARLPGQTGAFAAAILTGDRSAITRETAEQLRGANLSHLLAISGLHMGLLTGALFYALRLVLALIPGMALRHPIKKYAAAGAFAGGAFYLALSGFNVATQRAFVMVAVMLVAVLLDRRAISLRAVALAALIILTLQPEVLPEPGFQMSFAATTALVAVFTIVRRMRLMMHWPYGLRTVTTVVLSSTVAGIATAPVAAAHFNRIADYGLLANIAAVPMMGLLVIPAAVTALLLVPFGAQGLALAAMGAGINWILWVAATVSSWQGAVSHVPTPPVATLPLIGLGGLFVILWRGRGQFFGLLPMLVGFALWSMAERPALLIADDGALTGRMTLAGRALSKATGSGFAAQVWLENDGDVPDQQLAAARENPGLDLGGLRIEQVNGRGWQETTRAACAEADVVILNKLWDEGEEGVLPRACQLFDLKFLRQSGALALSEERGGPEGVVLRTAYGASGIRLWNTPALRGRTPRAVRQLRADLPDLVLGGRMLRGRRDD